MAYLSDASVLSSEKPPSEISSVGAHAEPPRKYYKRWTHERLGIEPRRNDALNHYLGVHRRTKPWPYLHSLLTLGLARYLVAVLSRRPWPDHVAKRIVAFLVLGQQ